MLNVPIPNLQDPELNEVIRKICLLAATLNDIMGSGTTANRPVNGTRRFWWSTDDKQLSYYTGDATVGIVGWIIIG